jgi:hypothetical protein
MWTGPDSSRYGSRGHYGTRLCPGLYDLWVWAVSGTRRRSAARLSKRRTSKVHPNASPQRRPQEHFRRSTPLSSQAKHASFFFNGACTTHPRPSAGGCSITASISKTPDQQYVVPSSLSMEPLDLSPSPVPTHGPSIRCTYSLRCL